jgi:hypothetical protein
MKIFKKTIVLLGFALLIGAPVLSFTVPQNTFATTAAPTTPDDCERPILGIHPWFRGLVTVQNGQCNIIGPGQKTTSGSTLDLAGFIWRIALNIIDMALAAVGYITFFFILYGGFQFLTGGSNPGQIEKARKTILNAVIGFVISLAAVALINLVFGIIG